VTRWDDACEPVMGVTAVLPAGEGLHSGSKQGRRSVSKLNEVTLRIKRLHEDALVRILCLERILERCHANRSAIGVCVRDA